MLAGSFQLTGVVGGSGSELMEDTPQPAYGPLRLAIYPAASISALVLVP